MGKRLHGGERVQYSRGTPGSSWSHGGVRVRLQEREGGSAWRRRSGATVCPLERK